MSAMPRAVVIQGYVYTLTGQAMVNCGCLPNAVIHEPPKHAHGQEFTLSGFALTRWQIERNKLEADPDVSPEARKQILDGYAKAWSRA